MGELPGKTDGTPQLQLPIIGNEHQNGEPRKTNFDCDVPLVRQINPFWCGYANLSMLLKYQGYPRFTPDRVFARVHKVPPVKDFVSTYKYPRPDLYTLASVAGEISNKKLTAKVLTKNDYERLKNNPEPLDVLKTYLRAGIPCIVRTRGHFLTARGYNETTKWFKFNDSIRPEISYMTEDEFRSRWANEDKDRFNHPTAYLMMAVYPKRERL